LSGSRSAVPIFEVAACRVRERQREGIALALSGVPTGAGRGLNPEQVARLRVADGDAWAGVGISRESVYQYLRTT
jgi:hypothetical protein